MSARTSAGLGLAVTAGYIALMAAFVFEPFDFPGEYSESVVLVVLLGSQFALGFAVGRWWALVSPAIVVLILIPARWPSDTEFPVWFGMAVTAVCSFPLTALGVIVRRLPEYMRRMHSRGWMGSPRT
jgi:hypothetical protein